MEPAPADDAGLFVSLNGHWLRVEQPSTAGPRGGSYWFGVIGGVVGSLASGTPIAGSRRDWSTVWRDNQLVIRASTSAGDADQPAWRLLASREEVWSLSPEGRLVVEITETDAAGIPTVSRFVYERK